MSTFRKRLCTFFSECKNDALLELTGNKAYDRWKARSAALQKSIAQKLPPELLEEFEQYQEALSAVSGIESDYCYLRGIRDYLSIEEQFKAPNDWDALLSEQITGRNTD